MTQDEARTHTDGTAAAADYSEWMDGGGGAAGSRTPPNPQHQQQLLRRLSAVSSQQPPSPPCSLPSQERLSQQLSHDDDAETDDSEAESDDLYYTDGDGLNLQHSAEMRCPPDADALTTPSASALQHHHHQEQQDGGGAAAAAGGVPSSQTSTASGVSSSSQSQSSSSQSSQPMQRMALNEKVRVASYPPSHTQPATVRVVPAAAVNSGICVGWRNPNGHKQMMRKVFAPSPPSLLRISYVRMFVLTRYIGA